MTIRAETTPTAREVLCQLLPTVPAGWRNSGPSEVVPNPARISAQEEEREPSYG